MPRKRTGCVSPFVDEQGRPRWRVGLTPPPPLKGPQKWWRIELEDHLDKHGVFHPITPKRARDTADAWNEQSAVNPAEFFPELVAAQGGAPAARSTETAKDWLKRWETDRKARGLQTRGTVGSVLKFLGDLKDKAMSAITKDDLEGVVERLDAGVQAGTIRKWKTAHNAWGLITKAFDDATNAKTRALRVRTDNPALGVRGPDRGERTAKQYLYPSEFLALIACDRVPLRWKRIFALAAYLYVRPGELEALEWEDVTWTRENDVDRGIVNVHRAIDRQRGGTKSTKTDTPRRLPIEPTLLPLLHAMSVEAKSDGDGVAVGPVVAMPPVEDWARRFRKYLGWAGVKRAELFADDRTRKQITFYDLRATGITWRAVRGDDPLKIMNAAGHKDFKTTQIYIREAEPLREGFGAVFPPLPASILKGESRRNHAGREGSSAQARKIAKERMASPAGFEPAYQG